MFDWINRLLNTIVVEVSDLDKISKSKKTTVGEIAVKKGIPAALEAMGYKDVAKEHIEAESFIESITDSKNFKDRSPSIQKKLTLANSTITKSYALVRSAYNVLI